MRQLNLSESHAVSGAGVQYYPAVEPGLELIGWEKEFVGWDVNTVVEYSSWFEKNTYITKTPIYDITPIYTPYETSMVVYYP